MQSQHVYRSSLPPFFVWGVILLCLSYFGIELFFNAYTSITLDEFWFAEHAYQFKNHLPYRDFAPYKTILGYYLLLIPLPATSPDILKPLIDIKNFIALLNTLCMGIAAFGLRKFFKPAAILFAMSIILFAEFFITYSTNIRVDIFAYWLCLFAVLLIFEERWMLAGILLALAFLTSQKALWYIFATNCSLGMYWLITSRQYNLIKKIILLNISLILIVISYLIFWSLMADPKTVINSVFGEAYIMATLDWYSHLRLFFWSIIVTNNPFPFLFWPFTLVSLFILPANDPEYSKRIFIVTYAFVIMLSILFYKQVFPYYMIATLPAFFLLYAALASWLIALLKEKTADLQLIIFAMLLLGVLYPLIRVALILPAKNGAYQEATIALTNHLLAEGGDYVAGIPLIYNKQQPTPGMKQLMMPAIDYLYHPTEKLRQVMLPSLSETPDITQEKIIDALQKSTVKIVVNNYRIHLLPPKIKNYLTSQYEHLWGSVYLYAPEILPNSKSIALKFSGKYRVESSFNYFIKIDGKKISPNAIVVLSAGIHSSKSNSAYRLKLMSDKINHFFKPLYQNDQWEMMSN